MLLYIIIFLVVSLGERKTLNMQFTSIWPVDRTLSAATIQGQSGPGSDSNEGLLGIPQCTSNAGTSPSNCLVSYPAHSLSGVLSLCREVVSVFYSPSRLGKDGRSGRLAGEQEFFLLSIGTTYTTWKNDYHRKEMNSLSQVQFLYKVVGVLLWAHAFMKGKKTFFSHQAIGK